MQDILEILKLLFQWFFDRKARLILMGYRPEVVCLVKETQQPNRYLIIRPTAELSRWVPPHEGILPNESIEDAAIRCLNIELGLVESKMQFRKSIWLGKRILPQDRWNERDLPYTIRRVFSRNHMVGKAYFGAFVLVDSTARIKPNRAEISNWEWVSEKEFLHRIEETNVDDKILLLHQLLNAFIEKKL